MVLRLSFHDNNTLHDDLVLHFSGRLWRCDSYYFAIDSGLLPEREDGDKVRVVLVRLHAQWLASLQHLNPGERAYLPFDLSDQGSLWLRCVASTTGYAVVPGVSRVEGWAFSPASVGALMHALPDFTALGDVVEVGTDEFLAAIRESASRLG